MSTMWKYLLLIIISYICYFPIFSIEDPMDELGAEIKFFIFTPLLLFVVGKWLLRLRIQWLLLIIITSFVLTNQTDRVYSDYERLKVYNQPFSNESFQNHFFSSDTAYSSWTVKKVSYQDHHVIIKLDKNEGDTEEELIQDVDEFVKEYTHYKNLHYLTVDAYFEGKTYKFTDIPLKKYGDAYEKDNESLQAVKNSLTKQ